MSLTEKKRKVDWNHLHLEFLQGNCTLNELRTKYRIGNQGNFYKQTRGWLEEREKMVRKVLEKVKDKTMLGYETEWKNQMGLWRAVESQAAKILRKHLREDEEPLKASDLASLSMAIEKALKGQKLIVGEPTETIQQTSLHLQLIEINKRIERGDDLRDMPEVLREAMEKENRKSKEREKGKKDWF